MPSTPPPLPTHRDNARFDPRLLGAIASLMAIAVLFALILPLVKKEIANGNAPTGNAQNSGADGQSGQQETGDQAEGDPNGTSKDGHTSSATGATGSADAGKTSATSSDLGNRSDTGTKLGDVHAEGSDGAELETSKVQRPITDEATINAFFTLESPPKRGPPVKTENYASGSNKAEFFGVEAKGRKFVYVVDVSSSMAGGKFEKARQELLDSIEKLGDGQYYYVLFFNDIPYYQPNKGLVPARSRQIMRKTKDWIMHAQPEGGTSPLEAINYAIQLHPDAVYVLSDGEFDITVVSQVASSNMDTRIPIHTISFETDAITLKALASDSGGTYRHVK